MAPELERRQRGTALCQNVKSQAAGESEDLVASPEIERRLKPGLSPRDLLDDQGEPDARTEKETQGAENS